MGGNKSRPRRRLAAALFAPAALAAAPGLRGNPEEAAVPPAREQTTIYVWDKAVWFAPHGHDPAEPPAEWTRRRRLRELGDYENDYQKPDPQDSSKHCWRTARRPRGRDVVFNAARSRVGTTRRGGLRGGPRR